jgi:hypothetical protein
MAQYFFKMNREEKDNILDQHKQLYDGYSTHYNQESNMTPLWVQDFANDKAGITVNNKGVVKPYTNMGINESHTGLDMIGDGPNDLENGTVNLDSSEYISLGRDMNLNKNEFDYDINGLFDDDDDDDDDNDDDNYYNDDEVSNSYVNDDDDESNIWEELNIVDEVDEDILPDFIEKLNESIDMFERFKKYN